MFSARKRQWRQRLPLRLEHIRMSEALIASLDDGMDVDDGGGAGAGGAAGCLREALELLRERHTPTSVPDRFCCKISMDVMMDPVVTPSGVTYERSSLREHLRRRAPSAARRLPRRPGLTPPHRTPRAVPRSAGLGSSTRSRASPSA